jgi:hypothetical protein
MFAHISKKLPAVLISHWQHNIPIKTSPVDSAYSELQAALENRNIENSMIGEICLKSRSDMGFKRQYLRITYDDLIYDIFIGPFGNSTITSTWLGLRPTGIITNFLLLIPGISWIVQRHLVQKTYYEYDTLIAFQELVQNTVLDWVDDLTTEHGLPPISNQQRKPIMKNLLKKFPHEYDVWGDKWDRAEKN